MSSTGAAPTTVAHVQVLSPILVMAMRELVRQVRVVLPCLL